MSYTKLNKEIEKHYKKNGISFYYNALTTTKEEQELRLKKYDTVRDIIVKMWIEQKKYKELISCAHGGWFNYEDFEKPLQDFFLKENLIPCLKFLCEREIRFKIENTILSLKDLENDEPKLSIHEVICHNKNIYCDVSKYHSFESCVKYRKRSLNLLDNYIEILKKTDEKEYINMVENIREKVFSLTIKKSDLKYLKCKI